METRHSEAVVRAPGRELITDEAPRTAGRTVGDASLAAATAAAPARDRAPGPVPAAAAEDQRALQERLRSAVGADAFDRYLAGRAGLRLSAGTLEVRVQTRFMADLLMRRFGQALRDAAGAVLGVPAEVRFVVETPAHEPEAPPAAPAQPTPPRRAGRAAAPAPLPSWHKIEDFIVGPSNRLAYEAAVRVAEGTLGLRSGPLFIHGACGLGKTHLLQGIARRFLERNPAATVRYTTGEAFTNEFVSAVAHGRAAGARNARGDLFRRMYRDVDLLCIDDVHFLANKTATQNELLHTFDAIDVAGAGGRAGGGGGGGGGARVILASDAHPRAVHRFSDALVSRFLSGLVVQLDYPDTELCERIAQALAARRSLPMDRPAARAVAEHAAAIAHSFRSAAQPAAPTSSPSTSVRELEGLVTRVEAFWRLDAADQAAPITRLTVDRALGATGPQRPRRPVRAEQIIATVCHQLGVDTGEFTGRGRHHRVVLARSLVALLSRRLTTMSFPEIARAMGRPNHSTIITAFQRLSRQIEAAQPCNLDGPFAGLTLGDLADRLAAMIGRA